MGAFFHRPQHGFDDIVARAAAAAVEDLADQSARDARGDADAGAVDGAPEDGAGAVGAVAVLVAVAVAGEVF